ncbi:MAG: family 20 glycosylhydrolase [Planctomycetes bacterium]|nr:family 20 glycosylhydrolase [Planctomycetota bacterium]
MAASEKFVKGLHISAPGPADVDAVVSFIEEDLPEEGADTLVMEFDYRYAFEIGDMAVPGSIGAVETGRIADACRSAGVRLVPQFNCLGHQSWKETTFPLLALHPEMDEVSSVDMKAEDFYCRSWCPLHPEVHALVLPLMDEIAVACRSDAFHLGMDEVFIIADEGCPRCRGRDPAELFAGEVAVLHEHFAMSGIETWIWGDRLINGSMWGISKWDASRNGTHPSVDMIPPDIVICDWHYGGDPPPATPYFFAGKGFRVLASPWRKENVAFAQLDMILDIRRSRDTDYASRGMGMLQTTWCSAGDFVRAYRGELKKDAGGTENAVESAACFKALFTRMRNLDI